ncbi:MAG: response regulator [Bacteroidota bacterium]
MSSKNHILFVDDEAGNRLSFKAYFRRKFPILVAPDAAVAKAMLQALPISLVLSDQRMPGISGMELFVWLQRYDPRIVRVLASGSTTYEDKEQAMENGIIHAWVQKPWNVLELEQKLSGWYVGGMGSLLRN